MNKVRYNISQQYGVDKGVSLKMLCSKMPNEMYRKIMQSYVTSVTWKYKIYDDSDDLDVHAQNQDIKILEVHLQEKMATELIMEMIAGMFSGFYVVVFICKDEMAMGAAREKTSVEILTGKKEKEIVATAFMKCDFSRKLAIVDYEKDAGKTIPQIFDRMMKEIRLKKKEIQMQEALVSLQKAKKAEAVAKEPIIREHFGTEFSTENLARIRNDAEFIQARLSLKK